MTRDWTQITCLVVKYFNHYTRMFSVLVWGYNWILFKHGWFCSIRLIHLIGQKSLHFEKKTRLTSVLFTCTLHSSHTVLQELMTRVCPWIVLLNVSFWSTQHYTFNRLNQLFNLVQGEEATKVARDLSTVWIRGFVLTNVVSFFNRPMYVVCHITQCYFVVFWIQSCLFCCSCYYYCFSSSQQMWKLSLALSLWNKNNVFESWSSCSAS